MCIFKLPNLVEQKDDILDIKINKLVRSINSKSQDCQGTDMKNLFLSPVDIVKSKLEKRLKALECLSPINKHIKLSSNQSSFMRELKLWLEKAINTDFIIFDTEFINEFKLTESGDIYKGENNSKFAHGNGVCFTQQNNIVEGKFFNGVVEKWLAKILYSNGEFYTGQVSKEGDRNGHGIYFYLNGDVYDGQFVHNKRIGQSRLRFVDGSEYIGQFINDEAEGHGIYTDIHGNRYMSIAKDKSLASKENKNGFFLKGRLYGKGELTFKNGDMYVGEFKGTKRHGYGVMKYIWPISDKDYSNLGEYKGEWKNDVREGAGEMSYLNGSHYKGIWVNDLKSSGELKLLDGTIYNGYFKNGNYHGKGKLSLLRGITVEGRFIDGEIGSSGKITFQNGNIFKGTIENYSIGEEGKLIYFEGDVYEGFFANGLRHGFGTYLDTEGNYYQGRWEGDRKEGKGVEFLKEKQEVFEGMFRYSKRNGPGKSLNYKGELYDGEWRDNAKLGNKKYHSKIDPSIYNEIVQRLLSKKSRKSIWK